MSNIGLILLSSIVAGSLAVAIAIGMGAGWGWIIAAYVLGGNVGLLMTGLLVSQVQDATGIPDAKHPDPH